MPVFRVFTGQRRLDDLEAARQLGQRLWTEDDLHLDFGQVEDVTPEFAAELCRTIVARRSPAVLASALRVQTMAPQVQAAFLPAITAVLGGTPPGPSPKADGIPAAPPARKPGPRVTPTRGPLNPFAVLDRVQRQYLTYVRTFQRFQNPEIRDWVLERVQNGTLLWKPPFVQLSRPFAPGEALANLVAEGLLHPHIPTIFRRDPDDLSSPPVDPYRHQTEAIRRILGVPQSPFSTLHSPSNVVVATGTGSGKSFCFGIPIVSECLRLRGQGVLGIKAVIVYPMNALANSQYDDFAQRLHGSGLTIARYTGDTAFSPAEALEAYHRATGREQPYDSEILSREEIQATPPDILMTNYVMLELLLTRFDDRRLFATPGVLRFLVLDEVHTYTGRRGADVAALIRRLKQHTHTGTRPGLAVTAPPPGGGVAEGGPGLAVTDPPLRGGLAGGAWPGLRCIATSATVESTGD